MPVPRKSTLARNTAKTTKKRTTKKKTPTSRAKKGAKLLVTCAPVMPHYIVEDVASSLHGAFFTDTDGRYLQVVAVRIDGQKVYGKCQEMYEAASFMFAPVEMRGEDHVQEDEVHTPAPTARSAATTAMARDRDVTDAGHTH
jgi:hypothetical protein